MSTIKLGDKIISNAGSDIYMIAEIGQNHQGCIVTAKRMIQEAKHAGVDCVKFQKSNLSAKFTKSALERVYDGPNSWGCTYGEHKAYLEFSLEQYKELQNYCSELKIDFTASAMDEISLTQLAALDVPFIKIGSGDANNFPMLEKAAKLTHPLVISTGMQTLATLDRIVAIMKSAGKTNFALLHCVSAYPTAPEDSKLSMITFLRGRYPDIVIGYSGHEEGIELSKVAVLLGARIVERHFTLDKTMKGSDHKCSLTPAELSQLISELRLLNDKNLLRCSNYSANDVMQILDKTNQQILQVALKKVSEKVILPCELSCKQKLGKSVVAAGHLKGGQCLRRADICIKVSEPNGIPAEYYHEVLGGTVISSVEPDQPIMLTNLIIAES